MSLEDSAEQVPFDYFKARVCRDIETEVRNFADCIDSSYNLKPYITDGLRQPGKLVRPLIAYMFAEDFGIKPSDITSELLVPIHLLHTSSLIKDDLPQQDNAQLRRGQPAFHIKHGEATAQLTADYLLVSALTALGGLNKKFGPERTLQVTTFVGEKVLELAEGQARDLAGGNNATIDSLTEVARLKTGSIFEVSAVPLAILSGASDEIIADTISFAQNLGIAFQIKDDILDTQDPTDLKEGKGSGIDQKNGRTTFVKACGGVDEATGLMHKHAELAKDHLSKLPGNEPRRLRLINSILYR